MPPLKKLKTGATPRRRYLDTGESERLEDTVTRETTPEVCVPTWNEPFACRIPTGKNYHTHHVLDIAELVDLVFDYFVADKDLLTIHRMQCVNSKLWGLGQKHFFRLLKNMEVMLGKTELARLTALVSKRGRGKHVRRLSFDIPRPESEVYTHEEQEALYRDLSRFLQHLPNANTVEFCRLTKLHNNYIWRLFPRDDDPGPIYHYDILLTALGHSNCPIRMLTNMPFVPGPETPFPESTAWALGPHLNLFERTGFMPLKSLIDHNPTHMPFDWSTTFNKLEKVSLRIEQDSKIVSEAELDFLGNGLRHVKELTLEHRQNKGAVHWDGAASLMKEIRHDVKYTALTSLTIKGTNLIACDDTWVWLKRQRALKSLHLTCWYGKEVHEGMKKFVWYEQENRFGYLHLRNIVNFHLVIAWLEKWKWSMRDEPHHVVDFELKDNVDVHNRRRKRNTFFNKLLEELDQIKENMEAEKPDSP